MLDLSQLIRPGDALVAGQACAEPASLLESLVAQRASLSGCRLFLGLSYSGIVKPAHADHLRLSSYCGTGTNRALADAGVLDILPVPYSQLGPLLRARRLPCDVVLLQVSRPNARGEYSLGLGVEYLAAALSVARTVIAEVNDQVPWTYTQPLLRREQFAAVIETSRPPEPIPSQIAGQVETRIAAHAAAQIPEGATIECGIGTLPNAVLAALAGRSDLSYHSGAIVDNARNIAWWQCRGGALMGTPALFEWARENPRVTLVSSDETHGAPALGRIERFVAINSAVEVDLTGQVNGEVARGSYVGAVGGALDFVRAANQSHGGLSMIVLPAARIVERLSGPVSIPRSEAGLVVTELGVADLRSCSLGERELRLRAVASKA